ncbi:MAG: PaaI family thioesterase [Deltaproteobacteria bacterium]|nr:PaaI family thioesterase [Deltaproteobacteria bacterium]
MEINLETLETFIIENNPYAKKTGVRILEAEPRRVKLSFPYDGTNFNPFGSYHAGALFTFGETAAAALIGMTFDLTKFQMLVRNGSIRYLKQVRNEITIDASFPEEEAKKTEEKILTAGKGDVPVTVQMKDQEGDIVCEFTCAFYMRLPKK